jgi:hypothetical protein
MLSTMRLMFEAPLTCLMGVAALVAGAVVAPRTSLERTYDDREEINFAAWRFGTEHA